MLSDAFHCEDTDCIVTEVEKESKIMQNEEYNLICHLN